MKNLFYFILPLIAAAAYADDYYFVGGGTPTTANPSGSWSHFVDGALVAVDRQPMQGEDNLVFDGDYIKSNVLYVTTTDNYGNDLIISNLKNDFELSAGKEVMAQDVYWDLSGKISVIGVEGVWDASKSSFTDNSKVLSFTYTDDSIDETLGGPRIHLSVGSIEMMADGTTATNIMTHKAKLNLGRTSKALSSITVQNDVKLYSRTALVMNATNIKINGIVGLYAEAWTNSATLKFNATSGSAVTVELGGLVAAKQCAEVSNAIDAAGTSTTLIFKNAAGTNYTYNGKLMDGGYGAGDGVHLSKMNIVMDGEGIQCLSPQDANNCYYTGTVTVKNGTLYLFNQKSAGDTYLEGGRLGILYSGRGFLTTGFHWSGGVLELDVKSASRDNLQIGGFLEKVGDGKLVFDLNLTSADYDAIELGSSVKYDLLSAESISNFGDSLNDDFEILGMDYSKFAADFIYDETSNILSTVITHVPEPEAAAALLGGLALALIAFKRRGMRGSR